MLHNISFLQNYGQSPVFIAAFSGHAEAGAVLLSNGADVNQADNDLSSPLYVAAAKGHDAVVAVLLSHGADVNQANNRGNSPLCIAVAEGHYATVAALLSHGADVNQKDNFDRFPLFEATANSDDFMVALLLSNGADVNQAAGRMKSIDIATNQKINDMLIAHTIKQQQPQQQPPPGQAPSNGQAVPKMVDESQWFQAAEKGDLAVIQQGINDKFDVNCRDIEGRTAVYLSSQEGHLPSVEYLINQHADLNIASVSAYDV